jgi:hypothetical protein
MINKESLITNYPLQPNSYTAFDAISLRNLIIERLNKQGVFTDQNYVGSNLASIIDIISFAFNTLIFYLNRTSSEATFTEAQLYENINRIVKLLDYKPIGYQTSTLSFQVTVDNTSGRYNSLDRFYTIPRYSYVVIAGIPFSFSEDISFSIPNSNFGTFDLTDISNRKLLYQGVFKQHPIYTSVGDNNEVFTLQVSQTTFVDHFNVHVYVFETKENRWYQYKDVQSLYLESGSSRSFEKRLNHNLQYEIVFGDNIHGRKLLNGEQVVIFYLESMGPNGVIGPKASSMSATKSLYNSSLYEAILSDVRQDQTSILLDSLTFNLLRFDNVAGSTEVKEIESVEEIKKSAPSTFRSQYRLVTQQDYENWIKTNFTNYVSDVKVFNNWEYTSQYLKYFNNLSLDPLSFQQVALNQVLYSDACNFNNVYLCAVPKIGLGSTLKYLLPAQKEAILFQLQSIKTLTTEITFLDPFYKGVFFGIKDNNGKFFIEDRSLCRIEIIKNTRVNKTNQGIILEVATVFQEFFNPLNQTLGNSLDYNKLLSNILAIDGIQQVNTLRVDSNVKYDGLSFCSWNSTYPELDNEIFTRNIKAEPFEFLYFENLLEISNYITVSENLYFNN